MPPRRSTRGNAPPPLTQDTMNRMIQESVEATIWAKREREFKMKKIMMEDLTLLQLFENVMMTEEFCPPEEIRRMKCELWNLRVKETDISSYTTRFNELMLLCPGMVPTEQKKVEAYIRGLSKNIKEEVTSSEPTTLNKAVRMTHNLIEQKVKVIEEREADNKSRGSRRTSKEAVVVVGIAIVTRTTTTTPVTVTTATTVTTTTTVTTIKTSTETLTETTKTVRGMTMLEQ
nr:hypothetical protein [Tanacetum cinerariifolium]